MRPDGRIEAMSSHLRPAVFHWDSQGRLFLPWEAKALDGLELPNWLGLNCVHSVKVQFLFKFIFRGNKKFAKQSVKRAKCDQTGNLKRPKGRITATRWASQR